MIQLCGIFQDADKMLSDEEHLQSAHVPMIQLCGIFQDADKMPSDEGHL